MRNELDGDIDDLRELLQADRPPRDDQNAVAGPSRRALAPTQETPDADYDQFVRTMAFESRAKPKNRTKTEQELATEEAEVLQNAEAKRLKRMRGDEDSDDDAQTGNRGKRRGDADDLDDDFMDGDDALLGPGLTREDIENMRLPSADDEHDADEDESEEQEDDEDDEGEEDDDSDGGDEPASDMDDLEMQDADAESAVGGETLVKHKKTSRKNKVAKIEVPYTFPCPADVDELEEIMDDLEESALPIVVQRIRACHHPSLAEGNKGKLAKLLNVLLDYSLVLAARSPPALQSISSLMPHIFALVKLDPISAAHHSVAKLALMQKNLTHGLARGPTKADSKTFPEAPELVFLRIVGSVWSTSDFSHPVAAPAMLLMGQYLAQCQIRRQSDIASGLFVCSLIHQVSSPLLRPRISQLIPGSVRILLQTAYA